MCPYGARESDMAIKTRGELRPSGWRALAVAALAIVVEGAQAAFPGANGRIAFIREEFVWPPGPFPVRPPLEPDLVSSRIETVLPNGRGRRVLHSFAEGETGRELACQTGGCSLTSPWAGSQSCATTGRGCAGCLV
jgi:hypothetical protein